MLHFITAAPAGPPQELKVVLITSRSLKLSWFPPLLQDHNGIIREYRIRVTDVQTGNTVELVSTSTSITIQPLHPYYVYHCNVAAYTIAEGPYAAVEVQTPEDGMLPKLELISAVIVSVFFLVV